MATVITKHRAKAVEVFHALGDDTRLEILERLRGGERCVCELTDALQTGQSRLSFHLKVLKDAGLIHDRPEGRWIYYSINSDAVEEVEHLVQALKEGARVVRSSSRC
jgi:ArsR family transcriptional regulator, arsenate/arsenite/antimonite-responsive transcriptional repressor